MPRYERKSLRAETRRQLQREGVNTGICTAAEADETAAFIDELSDRELSGELTPDQARRKLIEFSLAQVRKRAN
jgi:hypothetical protein